MVQFFMPHSVVIKLSISFIHFINWIESYDVLIVFLKKTYSIHSSINLNQATQ